MNKQFSRRRFLLSLGAIASLPQVLAAATPRETEAATTTLIGAAWRGPNADDSHYAGVLVADWVRRTLKIRYAVALPSRPHGLLPEAGGGLLVSGLRPGAWMLRCDGDGIVSARVDVAQESATVRLSGHVTVGADVLYTTEIDYKTNLGRLGVRDRVSLKKLAEWDSGGIEPHQALLDDFGNLLIANGGVLRTLLEDKKYDLHRMDSTLVRMDSRNGDLLGRWKLNDPRLSLRHLAWNRSPEDGKTYLGIAMQAEHDAESRRASAPILAVFEDDMLVVPSRDNDDHGYAGDISAAFGGGFVLSSNKGNVAMLWQPGTPDKLTRIVELQETYALAAWAGPQPGGGVLVATAPGLVRWHPRAKPVFLAWPQPMALDNHWVTMV